MGSKTIYYDYLYLQHYSLAESPSILVVTLFVSLLWPTFFMGVSLPLLARGLTHEIEAAAGTVGALYGINGEPTVHRLVLTDGSSCSI